MSNSIQSADEWPVFSLLTGTVLGCVSLVIWVALVRADADQTVAVSIQPAITVPFAEEASEPPRTGAIYRDVSEVQLYFRSGSARLSLGASRALQPLADRARAGERLAITGFHDETGDPRQNEILAMHRSAAIRKQLIALGAPPSQLTVLKSTVSVGDGSDAQARRVAISIVKE